VKFATTSIWSVLVFAMAVYPESSFGFFWGLSAGDYLDFDHYADGTVSLGVGLYHESGDVEIGVEAHVSGQLGVDYNHYFGGWELVDEYYDAYGDYVCEYAYDNSWLDLSIGYYVPLCLWIHDKGVAVEFFWKRTAWDGDVIGFEFTQQVFWEF